MRRIKVFDAFDYSDHNEINEEGEMLYYSAMDQLQEMIDQWQNEWPHYMIVSITQTESQALTPAAHNANGAGSCTVHVTMTVLYDDGESVDVDEGV